MKGFLFLLMVLTTLAATGKAATAAQNAAEADKSALTRFVEDQLSAQNRQIRLNDIKGALSSDATIGEITIADRKGIWLRIVNAHIVWTRSALLFGRLEIDKLGADRIEVLRKPLPAKGAPAPSSSGFSLPKLPVSVTLKQLDVPQVDFGRTVFGLKSRISVNGGLKLADGVLDSKLAIKRLDGPGGTLKLDASYADNTKKLALDLQVDEPENGILANLLNIYGRPAVGFSLKGSGPVGELALDMTLDAGGKRALTGKAMLHRTDKGLNVRTDVHGPLADLVAPAFRQFFGDRSELSADALLRTSGGLDVNSVRIESGALSLTASATTTKDNFLKTLKLDAGIANKDGSGVLLPVAGRKTMVRSARLKIDYGNAGTDSWGGRFEISRLGTSTFGADAVQLDFGGTVKGIETPKDRSLTYRLSGAMTGISTSNPDVRTALGDSVRLAANGDWKTGSPVTIGDASIEANRLALKVAGAIRSFVFDGSIGIRAASLAPFAALANRPLAGSIDLSAKGKIKPLTGGFDLTFDGSGKDLQTGSAQIDPLLGNEVKISGRLARTRTGFAATDFFVGNDAASFRANGVYAPEKSDFNLDVMLADLSLVTDRASGRITLSGSVKGTKDAMKLDFNGAIPAGKLAGRALKDAKIGFSGNLVGIDATQGRPYGNGISGKATASASLSGETVALRSTILVTPDEQKVADLRLRAGGTRLTGNLDRNVGGLIEGTIRLDSSDLSTVAALAAVEAKGSARATVRLARADGRQHLSLDGTLNGIEVPSARIASAGIKATIDDLFGVPRVDGRLSAKGVAAGGIDVATLSAHASSKGAATSFDAMASLANGTDIATAGSLAETGGGYRIGLDRFDLAQGGTTARLTQPAGLEVAGQEVSVVKPIRMDVAGGRLEISGVAGNTFDLHLGIEKLPLSIANTIKPDLAAGGSLSGTASISGSRQAPVVDFKLAATGITARPVEQMGLPAFDLDASGRTAGKRIRLDARLSAGNGISAKASGTVAAGSGPLDLTVEVARFPLATLDGLAKGQNPQGILTGSARVAGTLKNPEVDFKASGTDVSAAPLERFGVAPLGIEAAGRLRAQTVTLDSVKVSNSQGLDVSGSGRMPLAGGGLDVKAKGTAPLSIANRVLADRGTRVDGSAAFDLGISGTLGRPVISGSVSTGNLRVTDPQTNLRFNDITVKANIADNRVSIAEFRAPLASGGTITAGGSFSLDPAAGLPADLTIGLNRARYSDGDFLTVTASGKLTVKGKLLSDPLIGGRVDIERADIGIPERLGAQASLTDVRHVHTPADVQATLKRARVTNGPAVPTARPVVVHLDLVVSAPRRLFVRGRGLDAEMGGRIRLTGPVTSVSAVGSFDLIRGRIEILGKRLDFDSGTITLTGSLDPLINLVATSNAGDVTVTVTVSGRASDPKIDFSSQPALPQDEVLAQLIFGRSLSDLSGFQIAQLAAAVAELSGGSNTSLLGNLRKATGLDNLDVTTDTNGNASVRAGRYIRDNVYLGVEAGAKGNETIDLNVGVTKNLKAKASAGTDGESSLGLFYEKDY